MLVKILRTVPLELADGTVVDARPGEEHVVTAEVAEALLRGHDADMMSEATGPAADVVEPVEVPQKKRSRRTKNQGAAPENK